MDDTAPQAIHRTTSTRRRDILVRACARFALSQFNWIRIDVSFILISATRAHISKLMRINECVFELLLMFLIEYFALCGPDTNDRTNTGNRIVTSTRIIRFSFFFYACRAARV